MKLKTLVEEIDSTTLAYNIYEQLIFEAMVDSVIIMNEDITSACGMVYGNNIVTNTTDEVTLKKAKDKLLGLDFTASKDKAGCLVSIISKLGNVDDGCNCTDKGNDSSNDKVDTVNAIQKTWNSIVIKFGKDLANPTKTASTFATIKKALTATFNTLKA